MQQNLKMVFVNSNNALVSFTVSGVKETLTGAEVTTAMDAIITNNIFNTTGGDLVSKKAASLVKTDTTDFTIA